MARGWVDLELRDKDGMVELPSECCIEGPTDGEVYSETDQLGHKVPHSRHDTSKIGERHITVESQLNKHKITFHSSR